MGITVNGNVTIHNYVEKDATVTNNYYGTVVQGNAKTIDDQGQAAIEQLCDNSSDEPARLASGSTPTDSAMRKYFATDENALSVITWLHHVMDTMKKPKLKMLATKAMVDNGLMMFRPIYEDFKTEFPEVSRSTYSRYMNEDSPLQHDEIDEMVNAYYDWKRTAKMG